MKAIETKATVTVEGVLVVRLPVDLPPGERQVVVVIGDETGVKKSKGMLEIPPYPVGLISDEMTFRREDLYDD